MAMAEFLLLPNEILPSNSKLLSDGHFSISDEQSCPVTELVTMTVEDENDLIKI